jgi:hypothetical protein
MISEAQYFFEYTEFPYPIPVSGVGKLTLFARGSGTIYLQSLPDLNNTSIDRFDDIWLVPGLNDSIISKHWTKQHGLTTTLDDQENIIFTSNNPKSTFKATTQSIGKITVFPHIQALVYQPKAFTISTAPQRLAYRPTPATASTPPTGPRGSHAQQSTSSIPFAPIPRPSTYQFADTGSDHETPVTPISITASFSCF